MPERYTVGDLKAVVGPLGFCFPADNARFYRMLSEAEERMLAYGRWFGSIQEVQFCVRDCILTWPREVATIEQISLPNCTGPLDISNAWYQYMRTIASCGSDSSGTMAGWGSTGLLGSSCGTPGMQMLARNAVSFDVTNARGRLLRFYPAHSSDVGKTVTVQGRDSNGVWVRTNPTGTEVIDGEQVTLAFPFADTITTWFEGSPLGIIKEPTNYQVRLYDHDLSTLQERALGVYQPGETHPFYRTSRIPLLAEGNNACCSSASTCGLTTVNALVKLAHIDFTSDNDWLIFHNRSAYKEALTAIRDWENGDMAGGNFHFYGTAAPKQSRMSNQATLRQGGAIPMLRAELRSMSSDRTEVEIHYEPEDSLRWTLARFR